MTDNITVQSAADADKKRAETLRELYKEYMETVTAQPVSENAGGFQFVLGDGDIGSDIVLIGEAPGKDEVAQGRPFVGKAGAILTEFMNGAGIERKQLFITNTMKYRLAREAKGGRGGLANRPAKSAEIRQSAAFLHRELKIISPKVIVTLGNVPLKAFAAFSPCEALAAGIGECHGREFWNIDVQGGLQAVLLPLYHPASVIYNRELRSVYLEDLEKLRHLIEKERAF